MGVEELMFDVSLRGDIHRCESKIRPKISIVLLSLFRIEKTEECIASIQKADKPCSIEIIIFDNNSSKEDKERLIKLKENQDNMTLIFSPMNVGVSEGRNICINESKGKFILMLDNDCTISKKFIVNLFNTIYQDKKIGAVYGKVITGNKVCTIGRKVKKQNSHIVIDKETDDLQLSLTSTYLPFEADIAPGGATIYRRKIFDIVKHDPRFFLAHEDWDMMLNIKKLGYKIVYCPLAAMFHFPERDPGTKYGKIRRDSANLKKSDELMFEKWRLKRA